MATGLTDAPQHFNCFYKTSTVLYFSVCDAAAGNVFKTGVAWGAGDVKYSLDGSGFANTTNLPTEIATNSGIYKLTLVAAETTGVNVLIRIEKAGTIASKLLYGETSIAADFLSLNTAQAAPAVSAGSSTNTIVLDPLFAAFPDGSFVGYTINDTNGNYTQSKTVTGFTSSTQEITVDSDWFSAPTAGDGVSFLPPVNVTVDASAVWSQSEGAEPSGAIPDNATFGQILRYIKRRFFNNVTQTATTQTVFKDDSTTPLTTESCSYDGVTQVKGKGV